MTIGFLGGGQLACMSALQAYRFGFDVIGFTSANKYEPLDRITNKTYKGIPENPDDLLEFAKKCDVVTLENEFLPAEKLQEAHESSGVPFVPNPTAFGKVETKVLEKQNFEKAGIPLPPWKRILTAEDALDFGKQHGYPFMLKSSKGGYDGYGNVTVQNADDISQAMAQLQKGEQRELIGEGFISFRKELAVQIARSSTQVAGYPCCQTIQQNHICKQVLAPAPISEELRNEAIILARKALEAIDGYGLWAFEFFLTDNDQILLNECAPRPHNSGHYTIEGCVTSQFENHIRAICDLPLGDTSMRTNAAVMINLLGTQNGDLELTGSNELLQNTDGHLHLYGKKQSREGRKMGHYTLLGDNLADVQKTALELTDGLQV